MTLKRVLSLWELMSLCRGDGLFWKISSSCPYSLTLWQMPPPSQIPVLWDHRLSRCSSGVDREEAGCLHKDKVQYYHHPAAESNAAIESAGQSGSSLSSPSPIQGLSRLPGRPGGHCAEQAGCHS